MTNNISNLPPRLQEIVKDFQLCEGAEKIELLIQYSEFLPELPFRFQENREDIQSVPECMTPVFVALESKDGKLFFHFDVPPESPTVRGFAALMQEGLNGTSSEEILAIPNDFFHSMGLDQILTMQRLNGLSAILEHMKRQAIHMMSKK